MYRLIVNKVKNNRSITANSVKNQLQEEANVIISRQTVNRRLLARKLKSRVAVRKPLLTATNRKARRKWSRERLSWTVEKWKTVLFSDESSFQLFSNLPKRITCTATEKYNSDCLTPKVHKGGGSVMVWGYLSEKGRGELHFIDSTVKSDNYIEIMGNYMTPSKKKNFWKAQRLAVSTG